MPVLEPCGCQLVRGTNEFRRRCDLHSADKAEVERLRGLLGRCLPIIEADARMMADITRHSPLDAESQAIHDSTEYESEKLLREIPAALTGAADQPSPARDDARDAARYRWLVENAKNVPWSRQFPGLHAGTGLDDAIDKAIADSTEGPEL